MSRYLIFFGFIFQLSELSAQVNNALHEIGFRQRANQIIEATANRYILPSITINDPEKYYFPKAMARLQLYGKDDSLANSYLETFKNNSPFHFTLIGFTRLLFQYPTTTNLVKNKNLYFKKVFERTDADNAFTGEGTENHVNMGRTSGYLLAQEAIKSIPNDSIKFRFELSKKWIEAFTNRVKQVGNGEWNSSIYDTYSISGWLNIYDFAEDKLMKQRAKQILDYYAYNMALHYSWGIIGGAEMRGAGIGNTINAGNYLAWLWFGENFPVDFSTNKEYIQCIHAAKSAYRPPRNLIALAQKETIQSRTFQLYRPDYSLTKPKFILETFHTSPNFTLGSLADNYGGWTGTTTQIINWKLILKQKLNQKPIDISGNGRFYDEWVGKGRNPFTQIAQYKNILFQLTYTPVEVDSIWQDTQKIVNDWKLNWKQDFYQRFPNHPEKNVVKINLNAILKNESYLVFPENVVIGKTSKGYSVAFQKVILLIFPLAGNIKDTLVQHRRILINSAANGKICGWIMEVLESKNKNGFNKILKNSHDVNLTVSGKRVKYQSFDNTNIEVFYQTDGEHQEALVDWGFGVKKPRSIAFTTHHAITLYQQPTWQKGKNCGRKAELKILKNRK